jgi:hypothetical protein
VIEVRCTQGSALWLSTRAGIATASDFEVACGSGEAMKTLASRKGMERVLRAPLGGRFETRAMKRGKKLEAAATKLYAERRTAFGLEHPGIYLTDDRRFGYSPDAVVVGEPGGVEAKCPSSPAVLQKIFGGDVSDYYYQCQGGLWVTGWEWIDLIVYVPELAKVGRDLYVQRIARNERFIGEMAEKLELFNQRVGIAEAIFRGL